MNQLVPSDQTSTKEIGIVTGAGGSSIAPQNLGEVVRFAEVMARADIALPKHLRGNAGACSQSGQQQESEMGDRSPHRLASLCGRGCRPAPKVPPGGAGTCSHRAATRGCAAPASSVGSRFMPGR